MDISRAKEIVIGLMHYSSYREYGKSLTFQDKNWLFEGEQYQLEPNTFLPSEPSPWAPGGELHGHLPDLLCTRSESDQVRLEEAMSMLRGTDTVLGRIIGEADRRRGLVNR